jgi:transposase
MKPVLILIFSENILFKDRRASNWLRLWRKYRRVGIVAAQIGKKIISPLQYDGTMNSRLFEEWFQKRLVRELPTNSVIVMDNAAFHRNKQLISIAQKQGHYIIFLPPYSPELNPIENF